MRGMRWLAPIVLTLSVTLSASFAAADAVGPEDPSVSCPEGTRRELNHCGTECIRHRCETDADCFGDRVCRPIPLCAETDNYCGMGARLYERIHGACGSGGCAAGTCQTLRACVRGTMSVDAGGGMRDSGPGGTDSGRIGMDSGAVSGDAGSREVATYGCGCRVGTTGRSAPAAALALGLMLWARRRREERRPARGR